jgi:osmoprotectant transport system substrate-binding protein
MRSTNRKLRALASAVGAFRESLVPGGGAAPRSCVRARRFASKASLVLILTAVPGFLTAGCTSRSETVVVGSKNFTEQRILGELVAQAAERAGMRADRKLDLGGSFVCDQALRAGEIDVYVEYTGTAHGAILKKPARAGATASEILAVVREAYAPAGLVWTEPLGFDNTFALVVRGDAGATSISQAAPLAKTWRAAFGYEFEQRADGYPALRAAYGLEFADIRTMDLGLLYRALVDRQADVVVGSATDAAISRFSLRVLEDDRHAFAPYEAVPVVRQAALERHPQLRSALERLAGRIDLATMRRLNEAVEAAGRTPADVVADFLDQAGD